MSESNINSESKFLNFDFNCFFEFSSEDLYIISQKAQECILKRASTLFFSFPQEVISYILSFIFNDAVKMENNAKQPITYISNVCKYWNKLVTENPLYHLCKFQYLRNEFLVDYEYLTINKQFLDSINPKVWGSYRNSNKNFLVIERRSSDPFFATYCANYAIINEGKYYYEVEILEDEIQQIGWISSLSDPHIADGDGLGVGDDEWSWGYDGFRVKSWNKNRKDYVTSGTAHKDYGKRWKINDIVGCHLDLGDSEHNSESPSIGWSLNGEYMGTAFILEISTINKCLPFYPAVTFIDDVNYGRFIFNKEEMKYRPENYSCIGDGKNVTISMITVEKENNLSDTESDSESSNESIIDYFDKNPINSSESDDEPLVIFKGK